MTVTKCDLQYDSINFRKIACVKLKNKLRFARKCKHNKIFNAVYILYIFCALLKKTFESAPTSV